MTPASTSARLLFNQQPICVCWPGELGEPDESRGEHARGGAGGEVAAGPGVMRLQVHIAQGSSVYVREGSSMHLDCVVTHFLP